MRKPKDLVEIVEVVGEGRLVAEIQRTHQFLARAVVELLSTFDHLPHKIPGSFVATPVSLATVRDQLGVHVASVDSLIVQVPLCAGQLATQVLLNSMVQD